MPLPPYTGPTGRHTSADAPDRSENRGVLEDDDGPATRIRLRAPMFFTSGSCACCAGLMDDAGRCRCTA